MDERNDRMTSTARGRAALGWPEAAVEASIRTDGPDAGTRRLRVIAGDLDIELLPDRGLDLGQVRHRGVPLAWVSPTGWPRPSGGPFGATFGGGLVTTCGLLSFGPPSLDDEGEHPQHGRYTTLAATVTRAEVLDDAVVVEATIVEATVLGAHLELHRRIRVPRGEARIELRDEIVNRGARAVELVPRAEEAGDLQGENGLVDLREADGGQRRAVELTGSHLGDHARLVALLGVVEHAQFEAPFALLLHGLGDLLHDDLFDLLLELLGLPSLNGFRYLLLDCFDDLGNDALRHLFVNLLCHLDGFRFIGLLGNFGTCLRERDHAPK